MILEKGASVTKNQAIRQEENLVIISNYISSYSPKGIICCIRCTERTHILNELGIREHKEVIEDIVLTTMCRFGLLN